ncbi:MAG TPA: immunoglobulin-like domain-containing protein, partial [Candidatus Paceibacterota bacterium]
MKNIKLIIFILLLLSVNFKAHAYDNCYKSGYTVVSINGIFTDAIGAKNNKENLKKILPAAYKNESVIVDYIYNSTHLAGFGDIVDVVRQGFFDPDSDFDLVEMLNDASQKIKTQKVLLVGHSQGNFYANNFYDKVAGKIGGVPTESIGVYEVATPSNRVSGGGKYLTSDTDSVIASLVSSVKNIMAPNTHINLSDIKSNGHDFSEVYLKYRGDQIVSDIKSSFDKLSVNNIQDDLSKCISPQEISLGHKISGVVLAAADFVVNSIINIGTFSYNKITSTTKSLVGLFGNNTSSNLAAAGLYDSQNLPDVVESILPTTDVPIEVVDNNNQLITEEKVKNTNTESTSPVVGSSDNIEIPIITPNESVITTAEVDSSENSNGSGHDNTGGGGGSNPSDTEIITDKIGPVITIIGESIIKIPLNTVYVDAGATALDEKDGIIPVVSTGTVDITTIGTYTITYTTTDTENNVSTLNRVINIVKNEIIELPKIDTIAPVITLNGENNVNIFLGVVYIDAGATALDKTDGVISVVTTGVVDITKIETYTLTYTATDIAKNVSTLIRTVNVVAVPIIQNIPPSPVASTTATLLLPNSGAYAGDGLDPSRGRKNLTPFVFQVIYTD